MLAAFKIDMFVPIENDPHFKLSNRSNSNSDIEILKRRFLIDVNEVFGLEGQD